jgi:hypothetical protein
MRGIWRIAAGSRAWVPGCLAHVLVPKSSGRCSLVNCCKPSNQQHREAGVVGLETGFVGENYLQLSASEEIIFHSLLDTQFELFCICSICPTMICLALSAWSWISISQSHRNLSSNVVLNFPSSSFTPSRRKHNRYAFSLLLVTTL